MQARWFDEIVIPALNEVCPVDVLQHHPRSYADAVTKSEIKKEIFPGSLDSFIYLQACIQHCYLQDFWNATVRLATRVETPEFHDLFLVVSGHDLKHCTKQPSPSRCRQAFLSDLRRVFQWSDVNFPPEDCWLDFGMEDTPIPMTGLPAVTLLLKTSCLQDWAAGLDCPSSATSRTAVQFYPWGLLQDVGSMSVEVKLNNTLYHHGIAYNKSYNSHKALFHTPYKGSGPFCNEQYEALAFSQPLISKYYAANQRGSEIQHQHKRKALLAAYQRTKKRMATTLRDSATTNYGHRQEYRVRMSFWKALDLNDARQIHSVISERNLVQYVFLSITK